MSRALGDIAEEKACVYISSLGFQIIDRNFTLRGGEIDIIAIKDEVLHFIEVKSGSSYDPLYNITPKKLQHIINTAHRFMQKKNIDLAFQIDAISVQESTCKLIENITL
ncbi:YraN family protein [Campylobacterota bacterium]